MIKVGTDFSGIGSPESALKRLGIPHDLIFACDIDKYARKSYNAIHPNADIIYEDITTRDFDEVPQLDLYVAGFPCQAFSIAGKGEGFNDVRGTLFFNVADFIEHNQPECFILENVKGLLSHDKGRTFQTIIDLLSNSGGTVNGQLSFDTYNDGLGYHIYYKVLNTKDYGIPQNRERVFIIGFRDYRVFRFPKPISLELRLKDILQDNPGNKNFVEVDEKHYLSDKAIKSIIENTNNLQKSNVNPLIASTLQSPGNACGIYKGATYIKVHNLQKRSADRPSLKNNKNAGGSGHLSKTDGTSYCLDSGNTQAIEWVADYRNDEGLRKRKDKLAPCLTTRRHSDNDLSSMPPLVKQNRIRRLTPLECWRLQGFTDEEFYRAEAEVSDTQLYKQAGNSITVNVIAEILKKIYL